MASAQRAVLTTAPPLRHYQLVTRNRIPNKRAVLTTAPPLRRLRVVSDPVVGAAQRAVLTTAPPLRPTARYLPRIAPPATGSLNDCPSIAASLRPTGPRSAAKRAVLTTAPPLRRSGRTPRSPEVLERAVLTTAPPLRHQGVPVGSSVRVGTGSLNDCPSIAAAPTRAAFASSASKRAVLTTAPPLRPAPGGGRAGRSRSQRAVLTTAPPLRQHIPGGRGTYHGTGSLNDCPSIAARWADRPHGITRTTGSLNDCPSIAARPRHTCRT